MKAKRQDGYYYSKDGKLTEISTIPFDTLGKGLWLVQDDKGGKSKQNLLYHNIGEIKDISLYASLLVKYQDVFTSTLLKSMQSPNSINDIVKDFLLEITKILEKENL